MIRKTLSDRLLDALQGKKLLTPAQRKKVLDLHKRLGGSIGNILIRENIITQKDFMVFLSTEFEIPPVNLTKYRVDPNIAKLVPSKLCHKYNLIPISKIGDTITVAMADPTDILATDAVKISVPGINTVLVAATDQDIKEALGRVYGAASADIARAIEAAESEDVEIVEEEKLDVGEVTAESEKAPIVKIVSLILNEALRRRASDVHIEPWENVLMVRYRIDGTLQDSLKLPKRNQNAVLARLKIMAKLDITETRLPQDGRFKIKLGAREIDFRVSVLPIAHGNKIVLRALDKSSVGGELSELGFLKKPLETFKTAIEKPFGMMLLTGPTGSGKSTTLCSIVNRLNIPEKNVITVEDPVEYEIEGVTQIQVNADIGLTFANGLRAILRQSPDVVMVGEIRDYETADIAIKASLIGQLVLSTLHTNDAAGAITRLIDMGVEPFLVAASVIVTAAQRLCRKICPRCKEPVKVSKDVLAQISGEKGIGKLQKNTFYHGKGCTFCNNTGYYGRLGILEVLPIDDAVKDMIIRQASADDIKKYALSQGMMTLRDSALEIFSSGLTTLEEVLRVTSEE